MEKSFENLVSSIFSRNDFEKKIILPKGCSHFGYDQDGSLLYVKYFGQEYAIKFFQEEDKIIAIGYKPSDNGEITLSGGQSYTQLNFKKEFSSSQQQFDLSDISFREINTNGVKSIIDGLNTIPENYRNGQDGGYYSQEVKENGEPIVSLKDYGIISEDIYYKYSKLNFCDLVVQNKIQSEISFSNNDFVPSSEEIDLISFDNFFSKSFEYKQRIISQIAENNGIKINSLLTQNLVETLRNVFVLSFNNFRLRKLEISQDIKVRKEIAEKLAVVNRNLEGTGYSIKITNGLRTQKLQSIIKESHSIFKGSSEANRLFASEQNGPHTSGGAIDVELYYNGKKLDMKIGKNDSPTYSPENISLLDSKKIFHRNFLLKIMYEVGFTINPGEYWHFSYGDQMWAYITQKVSGKKTTAFYDRL